MSSPLLSGHTRLAAVIGSPVRHSLSPALHNAAFRALGLDWVYLAFEVPPGSVPAALDGVRALGIEGLSVTMPHKDAVAQAVDELSDAARALGAANCVVNRRGHLVGYNTDGDGFLDALRHECQMSVEGKRCAVLGAGGAARALVYACAQAAAAEVVVINRSPDPAARAAALAGARGRVGTLADLSGCDLVVNATAIGMAGQDGPLLPAPAEALRPDALAVDIVTDPRITPWMQALRESGRRAVGGTGMLTFQAARAFSLWTGQPAPVQAMLDALAYQAPRR